MGIAHHSISCKLEDLPVMRFYIVPLCHKEKLEEHFRGNLKGCVYQLGLTLNEQPHKLSNI